MDTEETVTYEETEKSSTSAMDQSPAHDEPTMLFEPFPAQSSNEFIDVPVMFKLDPSYQHYHDTISVRVNITAPFTNNEFLDQISTAAEQFGPLPLIYNQTNMFPLVAREFRRLLGYTNTVLFIWDFVPAQVDASGIAHFGKQGVSDTCCFPAQELVRHLRLVESGKIKFVYIGVRLANHSIGDTRLRDLPGNPNSLSLRDLVVENLSSYA
ncbi:hypothetical protein F5Y18DRAFT_429979 [Xylariaceae sp. FL1019]|nr:hypothetical protein F5Y18DRAFT_429979 [Xylariaceae sp. FL1019]